jgi:hypothetical protein
MIDQMKGAPTQDQVIIMVALCTMAKLVLCAHLVVNGQKIIENPHLWKG